MKMDVFVKVKSGPQDSISLQINNAMFPRTGKNFSRSLRQ